MVRTILIENDGLEVGVQPDYGARVISLIDKASGRDWIFRGEPSPNTGEDAVYSSDEAVGWDECFPTVSAYDATQTPWKRRLRDHGDLWGRPWRIDSIAANAISTTYVDPLFEFSRSLRLEGTTLVADYGVLNRGAEALPFLWALHGLLVVRPADRIVMSSARSVTATYLSIDGKGFKTPIAFDWPGPVAEFPLALDEVHPASLHLAGKLLAGGIPSRSVALGHDGQWLEIAWDEAIDALGIWLNYGAWPSAGTLHHIALEPTSAAADHLGQAIADDALTIAPGARTSWQVRMTASRGRPPNARVGALPTSW